VTERDEWKRRAIAVPVAIAIALVFRASDLGHFMQRSALTMPLHELGHATAAWFCGFTAIPTLWKTLIPETRGWLTPLAIGGGAVFLVVRGWRTQAVVVWVAGLACAGLLFVGCSELTVFRAQLVITFAGDAGAMVLGTLFMLTMFSGPDSKFRIGGLRYGLLSIGAAAFVDPFVMWWSARHDPDHIPFGEIEGVGQSDPSKLVDVFGWSVDQLVSRYVSVGVVCLIVLVVAYVWAVDHARRDVPRTT
jgi:hypothetical protein